MFVLFRVGFFAGQANSFVDASSISGLAIVNNLPGQNSALDALLNANEQIFRHDTILNGMPFNNLEVLVSNELNRTKVFFLSNFNLASQH